MSNYKAHNLPSDIIHNIVDVLQHDYRDEDTAFGESICFEKFKDFLKEFSSLQVLNKHWCAALRRHPAYMSYVYCYREEDFYNENHEEFNKLDFHISDHEYDERFSQSAEKHVAAIPNWLEGEYRQDRIVQKLRLEFNNAQNYKALNHLFENDLRDLKINRVELIYDYNYPSLPISLPASLQAHEVLIELPFDQDLVWSSFNENLRNKLTSLTIDNPNSELPNQVFFKKLSKLVLLLRNAAYRLDEFLQVHSTVVDITVIHWENWSNRPMLQRALGNLDKIETLKVESFNVDFNNTLLTSLKVLKIEYLSSPLIDWSNLPETIEELRIKHVGLFSNRLEAQAPLWREIIRCPHTPADINEYIGANHALLDPAHFHKLERLRILEISFTKSLALVESFNAGVWDNAMPQLEVLELVIAGISKSALDRFAKNHPHLKFASYGVSYGSALSDGYYHMRPAGTIRYFPEIHG